MFEAIFKDKLGPLALRLALGSVCVYHGYLKIMAGGGTLWQHGMPTHWQLLIAWGEFAGGLAVLLGLQCRLAAALILGVTVGSLAWSHGTRILALPPHVLEPIALLLLIGLAQLFLGAGEWSLDGRGGGKSSASRPAKKRLAA